MDIILTDKERKEVDYLKTSFMDIDVGKDNDFELRLARSYREKYNVERGFCFFIPDTEFGGIIEEMESNTSLGEITYRGFIWRGFLERLIIEPPAQQGYLIVSGDANRILEQILSKGTGLMFEVPEEDSGIMIKRQEFRYVSALEGLSDMLGKAGARLDIRAKEGGPGEPFRVMIRAVKVNNYSEEVEYNGDNHMNVTVKDYSRGINHLICLGKGKLEERMVLHLYAQLDGSISGKQYYTGTDERTAVYDYSSEENEDVLKTEGTKRLKELMNYKAASANDFDMELEIGDIVSARDRDTGTLLSSPIVQKIYTCKDGREKIECKLKGEV